MDWIEISRSIDSPALISGINSLAFDPYYELLWAGDAKGRVYSSYSTSLQRYSSVVGARTPIGRLLVDDKGVIASGTDSVRMFKRGGLSKWSIEKNDHLRYLRTMCFTGSTRTEIVVAGDQSEALVISATSGQLLRRLPIDEGIAILRTSDASAGGSRMTICGSGNGRLTLRDPKTFRIEHSTTAHLGGLTEIATMGNLIATAGYSIRHGQPMFDPLIKIYDVRNLRSFAPIPFPAGPSIMCPYPEHSSTLVAAANSGHWQVIDLLNPAKTKFFQADSPNLLTCLDVSPNGEVIAFGDEQGMISLWSNKKEAQFSQHGQRPPLAALAESLPETHWTSKTPFNTIGMPFYEEPLLSVWPPHIYDITGRSTKIDPEILAKIRMVDFVGYAPNPRTMKRNQIPKRREHTDGPKFRSQKEKERQASHAISSDGFSDVTANLDKKVLTVPREKVPKHYQKVEIKYSKFGVEDFDFGFYNSTPYSGLETHIINSYTNALLQVFHYLTPLRRVCISHTRQECLRHDCLCCELGFLFRMLEDGQGQNCQASNFLKAFSSIPQASALGLFDREDALTRDSYAAIIQNFNRFILDHLDGESNRDVNPDLLQTGESNVPSPISQLLGLKAKTFTKCPCGSETTRASISFTVDLTYPRKSMSNEQQVPLDFLSILSGSISRDSSSRAWCASCKKYQLLRTHRVPLKLPTILSVDTMINTSDQKALWHSKDYVPERFQLGLDGVARSVYGDGSPNEPIYELASIVLQVEDSEKEKMHLVSLIRMDTQVDKSESEWFLFNDFLVQTVPQEEALDLAINWKTPAVLYYRKVNEGSALDFVQLPLQLDTFSLLGNEPVQDTVEPLTKYEMPKKGTLIAIDAEFVALEHEEFEIHSDGTKSIIRPSRLCLARVSVLRGQGPRKGIPFLDDYIQIDETVVDYLTEYSGIHPGDLDPSTSKKVVIPLKEAYKKLRLLVDLGCIFVGHGLKKDFRIINLLIPPSQIIDTVDIYFLPSRHRKVSLRFLYFFLFKVDIQPESGQGHDSIIDAKSALECYSKYLEFVEEGKKGLEQYDAVTPVLENLYDQGRLLGWKPPPDMASK